MKEEVIGFAIGALMSVGFAVFQFIKSHKSNNLSPFMDRVAGWFGVFMCAFCVLGAISWCYAPDDTIKTDTAQVPGTMITVTDESSIIVNGNTYILQTDKE